jgi:hypothetical protein
MKNILSKLLSVLLVLTMLLSTVASILAFLVSFLPLTTAKRLSSSLYHIYRVDKKFSINGI